MTTEAIRSELRTVAGRDPYDWWDEGTPATRTDLGTARGIDVGADGEHLHRPDVAATRSCA